MSRQEPLSELISSLAGLPGIGEKTATRLAQYLVSCPRERAIGLAESIIEARQKVRFCSRCFNYAEEDLCNICANYSRDAGVLCVVETPADLISIERSGVFKGQYHVLNGVIAPLDGIGPDQLRIKELLVRMRDGHAAEVILATNPTMNGNATAAYISEQLKPLGVKVTRIAQGIPSGGDIGYADHMTLKSALDGRREMK